MYCSRFVPVSLKFTVITLWYIVTTQRPCACARPTIALVYDVVRRPLQYSLGFLQVSWPSRHRIRRRLPTRRRWAVAGATDRRAAEGTQTRARRRWTANCPNRSCRAAAAAGAWCPAAVRSPFPPTVTTTSRTYNTARYRIRSTCQLTITTRRIINDFSFILFYFPFFFFNCLIVCVFFFTHYLIYARQ